MQGKKVYQEKLFSNFQLSKRISESNFYRRLKEVLDVSFLYPSTKQYYGHVASLGYSDPVYWLTENKYNWHKTG